MEPWDQFWHLEKGGSHALPGLAPKKSYTYHFAHLFPFMATFKAAC